MSKTREYWVWCSIRRRCYDKKQSNYKWYGGSGISVSAEWRNSFEAFFADMGFAPTPKHEIDRINNNKGYSKENCRWATKGQNLRNKRNSKIWAVKGKVFYSATDAASHFGVVEMTIHHWCKGGDGTSKKPNCNVFERYLS